MTPNDLWPWLNTIGFLYSLWYTCTPNMRSVEASLLEISGVWGFHNLTHVDPKWFLTSTKNNRLLYSLWYTYIPNEICQIFPSWDIVFTRFSQCDPCWPLTSTKNNRLLGLNVVHLHTKYEICPSFPSWHIVFTRFSQFDPCWPQMTFDLHLKK